MTPSPAELRFHWYRLGNRASLCQLFGIGTTTLTKWLPEDDTDRYMRGQMVSLGGVLVKRCPHCGTARQVESFYVDNARASGVRAKCQYCREAI